MIFVVALPLLLCAVAAVRAQTTTTVTFAPDASLAAPVVRRTVNDDRVATIYWHKVYKEYYNADDFPGTHALPRMCAVI